MRLYLGIHQQPYQAHDLLIIEMPGRISVNASPLRRLFRCRIARDLHSGASKKKRRPLVGQPARMGGNASNREVSGGILT